MIRTSAYDQLGWRLTREQYSKRGSGGRGAGRAGVWGGRGGGGVGGGGGKGGNCRIGLMILLANSETLGRKLPTNIACRNVGQVPLYYDTHANRRAPVEKPKKTLKVSLIARRDDQQLSFGFGMSYTQFRITNIQLSGDQEIFGRTVARAVTADVCDTQEQRAGDEVCTTAVHTRRWLRVCTLGVGGVGGPRV
jgi:hypothetical protein